jgi:PPK2 family polyphosphate:nucleotide phosphotransferase
MKPSGDVRNARRLAALYRVKDGDSFKLDDVDPTDSGPFKSKEDVKGLLMKGVERLSELQEKLYAQDRWSLLLVFQAMDAAGKDSTIEHVMSGVNPQGVDVRSFKAPSSEELDHDFLWRNMRCLPERGRIGIFNRSYYEEVLVVRVHPELLASQHLPEKLRTKQIFDERFEDINAFERYLGRNGVVVRKFFLHVSKEEQRRRFLARLERPEKNWKFSRADLAERGHWKSYMRAYEDMIRRTSSKRAPWYVVPADHKWFTRLVVAAAIISTLEELDLHFPKVDKAKRRELRDVRAGLVSERD